MTRFRVAFMALTLTAGPAWGAVQSARGPDTVSVTSGNLTLRALLWRPDGRGPFPAVLFNHGTARNPPVERLLELGPAFARRGYVFLAPFRRGHGMSADQGVYSGDLLDRQLADSGQDGHNRLQIRLLETDHLTDAVAAVGFLRALPDVDPGRVAVIGNSFGGSLTFLLCERDSTIRVAVTFAAGASSWARSPQLRDRMLTAVRRSAVPVFVIHAANDYSVAPAEVLAAEMARLGKAHRVRVYPPVGQSSADGHALVYLAGPTWQPDVFSFLAAHLRNR